MPVPPPPPTTARANYRAPQRASAPLLTAQEEQRLAVMSKDGVWLRELQAELGRKLLGQRVTAAHMATALDMDVP